MLELRWILLGVGLVVIAGIWWWTARRSRQAPGDAQLREFTVDSRGAEVAAPAGEAMAEGVYAEPPPAAYADEEPNADESRAAESYSPPPFRPEPRSRGGEPRSPAAEAEEWGVPPFEPLSIRTTPFDEPPTLDPPPMMADGGPFAYDPPAAPLSVPPPAAHADGASRDDAARLGDRVDLGEIESPPLEANAPWVSEVGTSAGLEREQSRERGETQRIVTVRVSCRGDSRWPGASLLSALQLAGLVHGRYQVFHRLTTDGDSVFCAASLVEPGAFDPLRMPGEQYRGLTLFAVLPGPLEPTVTLDELFATAGELAARLHGDVQDAQGTPLTSESASAMRADVARFQAMLT